MESYDKEDEDEHERLMKEQDKHEKQSINELPHIDDAEYARMIEISEHSGRGDANMGDLEISDDEEEKLPQDMKTELRGEHQSIGNDEENEEQEGKQRLLSKQKSAFNINAKNRTQSQRPMNRPYKGPTAGSIPSKARFSEDFIILHYSG